MGAQQIIEQVIPQRVQAKPAVQQSINGLVVFDLSGEGGGQWTLDLTTSEGKVQGGSVATPKVTLLMTATDFEAMINGQLNAQQAFLTGKLKVKGDMGAALKLGQLLA
ncbi:MAG: SCP2 sterol-binding domain-containing protein [Deltaproteobacteria bacterium]|nr:SCP2 sterol-binding domain-containing protein [Deltaproteobacteria bacterium]